VDIKMLTRRTLLDFCARAASGHAVADAAITLMKSRRRIAFPKAQDCADRVGDTPEHN
jgi:hypothetical protein